MQDFRTPLQKQLDAKHKRNSIASKHFKNKAWFNGFTIQPSIPLSDIDAVELDRVNRIKNYRHDIGAK